MQQQEPYIYAEPSDPRAMGEEPMEGEDEMEDGEPASDQEQMQYNDLVTGAMSMLYENPDTAQQIAQKLKGEIGQGRPDVAIGKQAATIMLSLVGGLKQQGLQPDPDIVLNAGMEVLAEIIEIAERTGLVKPGDEQLAQDAAFEATNYFGDQEMKNGSITPEMQAQAKEMVAAEQRSAPPQPDSLMGMGGGNGV
jgi:hypothetical protein